MGVIKNARKLPRKIIESIIDELKVLMNSSDYDKSSIVELLKQNIPDFQHIETGVNLDQKM